MCFTNISGRKKKYFGKFYLNNYQETCMYYVWQQNNSEKVKIQHHW
jgi:hypothetical protein